jgi:hypothetical protein
MQRSNGFSIKPADIIQTKNITLEILKIEVFNLINKNE